MHNPRHARVTFVTREGSIAIRLTEQTSTSICEAATNLRATHFIAREGEGWGIFDMLKAQKDMPLKGEWSIDDPIKVFPVDALDAAEMYVLAIRSKR